MRRVATILAACHFAILSSNAIVAGETNTLNESEAKSGWTLLFDGTSLDQFRGYNKDTIGDGWSASGGAITFLPKKGKKRSGDLMTKEKFGEFELSLEYKISEGGNSGIMFRVVEQDGEPAWHSAPEVQVQDNVGGHDPQKAGWLYQLYQPPTTVPILKSPLPGQEPDAPLDATRPAGEWNHIHLLITNDQSELNLNGVRYYRFQLGSDDWNKKVAASKFSKYPEFAAADEGHIVLQDHGNEVAYRNVKIRRLGEHSKVSDPVDGELAVKPTVAFPNLKWQDWNAVDEENGKLNSFIPVLIENAGDGSNRLFVVDQVGVVYVFENRPDVELATRFMDIRERVQNRQRLGDEQGFLGLAFHPNFGEEGHPAARDFYVYYTDKQDGQTSVISRFQVDPSDPNKADPNSEVEILRADQPFKNHNGGTIAFGNDGYLYVAFGDGGAFYDPYNNAQNLTNPFGSVLRIDVDNPSDGKPYGIPADNPFVGKESAAGEPAMGEIFAYGFRNPWRLTNDPKTGQMWVADVGQNLWEEIDIVEKGGNYGWNFQEASAQFGARLPSENHVDPTDLIPPVWEYDHMIGKSITGGAVYRGESAPELAGRYVYGDYVTGKLFALDYDSESKSVRSNMRIPSNKMPVITFGQDESGEVYFGAPASDGNGVYKFVASP